MNLSPRNKLIMVAVGLVVVVGLLVALLVVPQFGKIADMESRISDADARAEQARALLSRRQEAKANAAFTDAALLELSASVPESPDLPSLLIELQDLAYENNVILQSVRPSDLTDSGSGFLAVPLEIRVRGSWAENVEFVQALNTLVRQIRVLTVTTNLLSDAELSEGVVTFDPYAVETKVIVETYVIPALSRPSTSTAVPAPPAGQ